MINFTEETVRLSLPDDQPVTYKRENSGSEVHPSIVATCQALLSLTSDLCCVLHENGSIQEVNASFLKILGYAENEILYQLWNNYIHPQDMQQSQHLLYPESNSNEKPTSVSYRFRKKNGRYLWLTSNSSLVHGKRQGMWIVICSQNITKEKKNVQRIRVKEHAKQWMITVEDNGIGIEKKYHQRIFEPFERLHGRKYTGTGMGLAIVKKILERYRGRIWVNSQLGQGATFYFTLRKSHVA